MYYNQGRSIEDIAIELNKSKGTKKKSGRPKIYLPEIINRIIELKKELSQRSAPLVHKWLRKKFY